MTGSGSPSGREAHAEEQHVASSGRSLVEPPSQDIGLHLEPLPGAASQAAAAEELHGDGPQRPAATRSLLVASQETLAFESEGMAPQPPAINPATALRTSSRKRAAAAAAATSHNADSWAAETLTSLGSQGRGPPPHLLPTQIPLHMEEPEYEEEEAGGVNPMALMAHMGPMVHPVDATQQVLAQQLGHLGLLPPWPGLDWGNLVMNAANAGLQMARGGRVRSQRYIGDSSDPEGLDMMPVRAPPRRGQHSSGLTKPEHANSVAKRRGPMDEMRQLMRILVQVIPAAAECVSTGDEGTSNNKVKERDIHLFLRKVLGNNVPGSAPYPEWGLPEGSIHVGWGGYLADLFSWATGREISKEEAMQCARRQQGRRWEAVYEMLQELGVYSYNWTVPLNQVQTRTAPPEIPLRLLREEQREPLLVEGPMAEAVVAAATAVGGPAVQQSIGLGVAGRKQQALGPKAKRQRSEPLLTHAEPLSPAPVAPLAGGPLPPTPSMQEAEEVVGRLPLLDQWKVLTNIVHNMENLVYETYSNRPAEEEELKARNRAWRAVTHLQDLCKQQEAQHGAMATADAAPAAGAGGGGAGAAGGDGPASPAGAAEAGAGSKGGQDVSQVQVPVLTMADLQTSSDHVLPLPHLSAGMAMLQGGQGLMPLPHAAIQQLLNSQLQPNAQAALAVAAAAATAGARRVAVQMEQVPPHLRLGGLGGLAAGKAGAAAAAAAAAGSAGGAAAAAEGAGRAGQEPPQPSPTKHSDHLRTVVHNMIDERVKPVA